MKYKVDIEREVKFIKTIEVEASSLDDAHDKAIDKLKNDVYTSFEYASQSDSVLSVTGVVND